MLGILLAATVVAAPPPPAPVAPQLACPAARQQKTVARDKPPGPQKLGDLPNPELYHAVWKEAGGCPIDEVYANGRWVDRWAGPPRLRHANADDRRGDAK